MKQKNKMLLKWSRNILYRIHEINLLNWLILSNLREKNFLVLNESFKNNASLCNNEYKMPINKYFDFNYNLHNYNTKIICVNE